jgi:hypothetical protein
METSNTFNIKGKVNIKLLDKNGNIKAEQTVNNLVVQSGLNFIASRMIGTTPAVMTHMEIGTGQATPALGNTTLGAPTQRVVLTSSTVTASAVTFTAIFPTNQTLANITEAGIFNASSGGTMLCRSVFNSVAKDVDDSLAITWTLTVGV